MRFTPNTASRAALLLLAASAYSNEIFLMNNANVPDFPLMEPNSMLDSSEKQDLYLYMQRAKDWADQRRMQSTANARLRMARPVGARLAKSNTPRPVVTR